VGGPTAKRPDFQIFRFPGPVFKLSMMMMRLWRALFNLFRFCTGCFSSCLAVSQPFPFSGFVGIYVWLSAVFGYESRPQEFPKREKPAMKTTRAARAFDFEKARFFCVVFRLAVSI